MISLAALMTAGIYVLAGAIAGLMSGLFGIGGGIVVVPALTSIFALTQTFPTSSAMHFAVASSLAIMLFTSQSAVRTHYKLSGISWDIYQRLWPGLILGTLAGSFFADWLPISWLKILFGLFLLFVAYKMLTGMRLREGKGHTFPRPWINHLIIFLIGFKSGLLGIGGGALIIPYLSHCGVEMRKITAVSALCTITVALMGTLSFLISGIKMTGLPAYTTGYIYWPAVIFVAIPSSFFAAIGVRLAYLLPAKQLKYAFIAFLIVMAIHLLI